MTTTAPNHAPSSVDPPTLQAATDAPQEAAGTPGSVLFDVWLPRVILGALPLVLLRPLVVRDPDTFWHIRAGHQLLASGQFVATDTWSGFSSNPWMLHEWAPEALLAFGDSVAGLAGVAWLWQLGLVLLIVALIAVCRPQGTLVQTVIGATAGLLCALPNLGPRPQIVSLIFLAVSVGAWLRTADDRRPRRWLVAMGWVWACCHGMWFLGPLVGFVVVAGMALQDHTQGRLDLRATGRLALVPALTVVAAGLTPVGPRLLTAPLTVSGYGRFVMEWAPPDFSTPIPALTMGCLVLVVLVWARSSRQVSWIRVGLWALALGWCLLYSRTVAVAAVIIAPLVTSALNQAQARTAEASRAIGQLLRPEKWAVLTGVVLVMLLSIPMADRRPGSVPSGLDPSLSALPRGTVVLNDYALGGWLDWAHPELAPVIDGRTEIFSLDYVTDYVNATQAAPGWQKTVAATGARVALLSDSSSLGDGLVNQLGWTVVKVADHYRLLEAPGGVPAS